MIGLQSILSGYFGLFQIFGQAITSEREASFESSTSQVFLYTAGLGKGIHTRYGHTLIRIVDPGGLKDKTYNWGMFDFSDPALPLNFFTGRLRYWVSTEMGIGYQLRFYKKVDKRGVWEDKLNFTPEQVQKFISLVQESSSPENKFFWYHHFYKNCATIPRDLINQVTDGQLKSYFENIDSGTTLRAYVRTNLNDPPFVGWFLDIVMNSRIDGFLSKWDEMFYPLALKRHLNSFVTGDDLDGSRKMVLLSPVRKVVPVDDPLPTGMNYARLVGFFLMSIALIFICTTNSYVSYFAAVIFSIFSSLLGLTMIGSWVFSEHLDLHHNFNLLLFWPTDLVWIWFLVMRKSRFRQSNQGFFGFRGYIMIHMIALFIHAISSLFGFIQQDVSQVLIYLSGPCLIFYIAAWRRLAPISPLSGS